MRLFVAAAAVVASSSICASSTGQVQYRGRVVIMQVRVCQGAHPISALPLVAFFLHNLPMSRSALQRRAWPAQVVGLAVFEGACRGVV